ncbi:MAG: GAF domain-containing protein, partial [Rhodothermales bacterium]
MLDDLARAFGCDRGLVVLYDPMDGKLRGASGFSVPSKLVEALEIPITEHPSVLVDALESGETIRVDAVARDPRLHETSREILLEAGFGRAVFVPIHSAEGEPLGVVVLGRHQPFGNHELRALAAVTGQAREVLTRVAEVRETSESDAVEKEWLWWMVNAQQDPVVLTDEANEIGLRNVPA